MVESKTSRKLVTLDHETIRRRNDYRFGQRISRESEALRRLIEIGLKQVEAKQVRESASAGR
jgi:hypothetical protein